MGTRVVKALAFPVYQKDWLFYAWKVSEVPADVTSQPKESSTESPGLYGAIANRVTARVEAEWESVKEAKEGTFKGYILRFASVEILNVLAQSHLLRPLGITRRRP